MKTINKEEIVNKVAIGLNEACCQLDDFSFTHLLNAKKNEKDVLSLQVLNDLVENATLASNKNIPMCQDTGIVTVFAYIGYDIHLTCDLYDAINEGVKKAYKDYYLRKSVADPLTRMNTNDNTPAIIHIQMVPGDSLRLILVPKGAGSENMSQQRMMNPTDGKEAIKQFVLQTISQAGGKPCPPLYIGIGIGGNFEKSALMAKEALLRTKPSSNSSIAAFEQELKEAINDLKIGPMGIKGQTTCFEVFINTYPCHIASLPVAINIQCHANRHKEVTF